MITIEEYLKSRVKYSIMGKTKRKNMNKMLYAINVIRWHYGEPMIVNSGYRSKSYNSKIGGSPNSAHTTCEAIDIRDTDGKLWQWLLDNFWLVEELDLYLEDRDWTPTWVHIQTRRTNSGNRIFVPYAGQSPKTDWYKKINTKKTDC